MSWDTIRAVLRFLRQILSAAESELNIAARLKGRGEREKRSAKALRVCCEVAKPDRRQALENKTNREMVDFSATNDFKDLMGPMRNEAFAGDTLQTAQRKPGARQ